MHPDAVPGVFVVRLPYRRPGGRHLGVFVRGEALDLEGADCRAVAWIAILSESDQSPRSLNDTAGGPRIPGVARDDRAPPMFAPGPQEMVRTIEPQRVVLERAGAREHPPGIAELEGGGIRNRPVGNQGRHRAPIV